MNALQRTEAEVANGFAQYRLDNVVDAIYHFVWDEYCDWYLELAKVQFQFSSGSEQEKRAARRTLLRVLETILRLLHPIAPFITEELWQRVSVVAEQRHRDEVSSIMIQAYPQAQMDTIDVQADAWMAELKRYIDAVRNLRGEMKLSPAERVPLFVEAKGSVAQTFKGSAPYLVALAKLAGLTVVETLPNIGAPTAVVGEVRLMLNVQVDRVAEIKRLSKEIDRLQAEINNSKGKLSNPNFIDRAPAAVVQQEKERLADQEKTYTKLRGQLELYVNSPVLN